MSNTYTKGYSDGNALTEAMLDNAYQTLQLDIANAALTTTGSTSGQVMTSNGSGIAPSFQTIPDPEGPFALRNYGLKATVASGVMTISLKTKALATPSGTDIVDFNYSTNGTTSASYSSISVTAATTISLNASATLGISSTATTHVFVYGYYNTVTTSVKLAISSRDDFDFGEAVATTAVSAAADSGAVLYATAALTIMPRYLGHVVAAHNSGGSWQTPSKVNITNTPLASPLEFNRARTPASIARVGQLAISSSSGNFIAGGTSTVDVDNLNVTINTTGRPIRISLVSDNSGNSAYLGTGRNAIGSNSSNSQIYVKRDGVALSQTLLQGFTSSTGVSGRLLAVPPGQLLIEFPAAGTYVYKISVSNTDVGDDCYVQYCKLIVEEI